MDDKAWRKGYPLILARVARRANAVMRAFNAFTIGHWAAPSRQRQLIQSVLAKSASGFPIRTDGKSVALGIIVGGGGGAFDSAMHGGLENFGATPGVVEAGAAVQHQHLLELCASIRALLQEAEHLPPYSPVGIVCRSAKTEDWNPPLSPDPFWAFRGTIVKARAFAEAIQQALAKPEAGDRDPEAVKQAIGKMFAMNMSTREIGACLFMSHSAIRRARPDLYPGKPKNAGSDGGKPNRAERRRRARLDDKNRRGR